MQPREAPAIIIHLSALFGAELTINTADPVPSGPLTHWYREETLSHHWLPRLNGPSMELPQALIWSSARYQLLEGHVDLWPHFCVGEISLPFLPYALRSPAPRHHNRYKQSTACCKFKFSLGGGRISFFSFYWSIVDTWCYISFRHTA